MKIKTDSLVGVIMGSKSDWEGTMQYCSETLKKFGVKHDVRVISAHRTPKRLEKFLLGLSEVIDENFGYRRSRLHRQCINPDARGKIS